jgi:tetratricopeptide (TPR) repeat protein
MLKSTSRNVGVLLSAFVAVMVSTAPLAAQDLASARRLFEAGKYQEAIDAVRKAGDSPAPRLRFLEEQCYERMGNDEEALRAASQLSGGGPVWEAIGQSLAAIRRKQAQEALTAATRAVKEDPNVAEAHYELGMALSVGQNFSQAASEFDRAAELDPQWAYARYYAGMAYSRIKRTDLLAARFQAFLTLAPNAPERPEVESIMRTIRGR